MHHHAAVPKAQVWSFVGGNGCGLMKGCRGARWVICVSHRPQLDAPYPCEYHGARVAPVAQLDRVLPSEGRGRGFESRLVRHILQSGSVLSCGQSMKCPKPALCGLFLFLVPWQNGSEHVADALYLSGTRTDF